jgi:hypothetical protein
MGGVGEMSAGGVSCAGASGGTGVAVGQGVTVGSAVAGADVAVGTVGTVGGGAGFSGGCVGKSVGVGSGVGVGAGVFVGNGVLVGRGVSVGVGGADSSQEPLARGAAKLVNPNVRMTATMPRAQRGCCLNRRRIDYRLRFRDEREKISVPNNSTKTTMTNQMGTLSPICKKCRAALGV